MSNHLAARGREAATSELVERIRLVEGIAEGLVHDELRPRGITPSQGRLLGLLADRIKAGETPLQKDLEAQLRLATSSITSLIQGMERKGIVERTGSASDGRAKELRIESSGPVPYGADGEVEATLPVTVRVRPGDLPVLYRPADTV